MGSGCGPPTAAPDARRRRTRGADHLSADRCPPTPSASPARLLIHLAAALAVWALALPAQHWRARGGLEVDDVCVDNHEALLCEHYAIGQTQPVHLTFLGPGPRPENPNCSWQRLKSVPALGVVALCLCWSARPYNAPRTPHALGLAQWLNGRRNSCARPRAGFCPPREPYRVASRAWCTTNLGLGPNFTPRFMAAARPPFARARMRARSSSARDDRKAKMPRPIGVVRSSRFRSSALKVAPRAATRSMILMPSSMDLVTRSHAASTRTSPVPSTSIALSS